MKIASLSLDDLEPVSRMIAETFTRFVAPTLPEEGIDRFFNGILPEALKKRLDNGNMFFVAKNKEHVVGMAEIRDGSHLNLLFVHPDFQGRGVARSILEEVVRSIPGSAITVNASLNSVAAYSAMGFVATGPESETGGIRFVSMARCLQKSS